MSFKQFQVVNVIFETLAEAKQRYMTYAVTLFKHHVPFAHENSSHRQKEKNFGPKSCFWLQLLV